METLRSGWLTTGERTARFEQDFKAYTGAQHALAVNSCTAGLHLALAAPDIGPGDEVITTPLTFCATVNTILHVGATPVLADMLPDGNIDPACDRATNHAAHTGHHPGAPGGSAVRMDDDLEAGAASTDLVVIEDAAHAAESRYPARPRSSGSGTSASDAVAFSFYATKNITTGEGGMVTTNDRHLAERMRVLCLHGISKDAWNRYTEKGSWYYEVVESGFKYNLSDIQSAIGIHQLREARTLSSRSGDSYAGRLYTAPRELRGAGMPAAPATTGGTRGTCTSCASISRADDRPRSSLSPSCAAAESAPAFISFRSHCTRSSSNGRPFRRTSARTRWSCTTADLAPAVSGHDDGAGQLRRGFGKGDRASAASRRAPGRQPRALIGPHGPHPNSSSGCSCSLAFSSARAIAASVADGVSASLRIRHPAGELDRLWERNRARRWRSSCRSSTSRQRSRGGWRYAGIPDLCDLSGGQSAGSIAVRPGRPS